MRGASLDDYTDASHLRAESSQGKRLNPRKAELHRWRETFAARLRERGIEPEPRRPRGARPADTRISGR